MNRRRAARQSSNVFTAFTQAQMQELKEIFNMLDITSDGNISREDIEGFLNSIGSPLSIKEIDVLMEEMGERFNFTLFLTTLCEHLSNIDAENVIIASLKELDIDGSESFLLDDLREIVMSGENRITEEEWNAFEKHLGKREHPVPIQEIAQALRYCGLPPSE